MKNIDPYEALQVLINTLGSDTVLNELYSMLLVEDKEYYFIELIKLFNLEGEFENG